MSYFVDTSFFVGLKNKRDEFHNRAEEIFGDLLCGKISRLYSSDYILDEAITTVRSKVGYKEAVEVGNMIMNSKYVNMIKVDKNIISQAFESYKKYEDKDLSFTDWTSYHLIKEKLYDGIVSPNHHFEQVGIYMLK